MNQNDLRLRRKRIRLQNIDNPALYVQLFLPLHPMELDELIQYVSGYDSYDALDEENTTNYYTFKQTPIKDIRSENHSVLSLSQSVPPYRYGNNPDVTKENGEIFTGRRMRGACAKPFSKAKINKYLSAYLTHDKEIANHYTQFVFAAWSHCYENHLAFSFAYGIGRELFLLPTETNDEESGILFRAEDIEFFFEKKEDDPTYPLMTEILYGNADEGFSVPHENLLFTDEESFSLIHEQSFFVPLTKTMKWKTKKMLN